MEAPQRDKRKVNYLFILEIAGAKVIEDGLRFSANFLANWRIGRKREKFRLLQCRQYT